MSSLTLCNFCNLQRMKRDAKRKNKRVVIKDPDHVSPLGGSDVHVIGKGEKPNAKNKVAWMWTITDTCVC